MESFESLKQFFDKLGNLVAESTRTDKRSNFEEIVLQNKNWNASNIDATDRISDLQQYANAKLIECYQKIISTIQSGKYSTDVEKDHLNAMQKLPVDFRGVSY